MATENGPPENKIAVALRYEAPHAPKVVAKGRGEIARTILDKAAESGVTIERNPLLAEALGAVDLDAEIPEELYKAVAEVIAFVLRTAQK